MLQFLESILPFPDSMPLDVQFPVAEMSFPASFARFPACPVPRVAFMSFCCTLLATTCSFIIALFTGRVTVLKCYILKVFLGGNSWHVVNLLLRLNLFRSNDLGVLVLKTFKRFTVLISENSLFSQRNYGMDSSFMVCFFFFFLWVGRAVEKIFLLQDTWLAIPKSVCGTQ